MSIRVGFSTSDGWVSRIIRWFTSSKVSHCFFVYYDIDWERDMVLEATSGGFRVVPYSIYEKNTLFLLTPKFPVADGFKKALDWLGSGYDYAGLLGMSWVEVGRWLKRKWRNPYRNPKEMFCSEAVVRVLQAANYPGTESMDAQSVDPQMLLDFFSLEKAVS